jgi:hypothetical protein
MLGFRYVTTTASATILPLQGEEQQVQAHLACHTPPHSNQIKTKDTHEVVSYVASHSLDPTPCIKAGVTHTCDQLAAAW